jgi:hypothetical protein
MRKKLKIFQIRMFLIGGLFLLNSFSFGQCCCAEIQFKIFIPNFETEREKFEISAKNYVAASGHILQTYSLNTEHIQSKNDTINFDFPTGCGIKELTFVIRDKSSKQETKITTKKMYPDTRYGIDLMKFTPGRFEFNWEIISKCIIENPDEEEIFCEELKFHYDKKRSFIRPVTLEYFAIKE